MSTRRNTWFQNGEGIAREVITADIQRYLGPDALVRPGESEGVQGYFITAYRTLTTQMVQDLKADSARWLQDTTRRGPYSDSSIHSYRQNRGPSRPSPPPPEHGYVHNPYSHAPVPTHPAVYPPSYYEGAEHARYTHSPPQVYPASQQPMSHYGQQPPPPPRQTQYQHQPYPPEPPRPPVPYQTGPHSAPPGSYYAPPPDARARATYQPPVAAPGYYIAADGNQYPLPPPQHDGRGRRG